MATNNSATKKPDVPATKRSENVTIDFLNAAGIAPGGIQSDGIAPTTEVIPDSLMAENQQGTPDVGATNSIALQFPVYRTLAEHKLDEETKDFKGNTKASAVHRHVATVLRNCIVDSERFAEVFYRTARTLSNCCEEIMKDVGGDISDFEVYRRATNFYFPNCEIRFFMDIDASGYMPSAADMGKVEKPKPSSKKTTSKRSAAKKQAKPTTTLKPASKPVATSTPKKAEPESDHIQISLF